MATTLKKFSWEPSWRSNISLKYNFQTVVERNRFYKEQRRALFTLPLREQKADFIASVIEDSSELRKLLNDLRSLSLEALAVPVWAEPIHPTGTLQGQTILNVTDNLAVRWNVKNSQIILLFSPPLAELKKISSVGASSITVTSAVAGAFVALNTIIWPCFPGMIAGKSLRGETEGLLIAEVEFREILLDWTI